MSAPVPRGTEWYREVQFIAGVPMPIAAVREYGTTVNGMWASAEAMTSQDVAEAHAEGRRVLFSVPMIALTPAVSGAPENRYLLDERCADVHGDPASVPWYYWEDQQVHSVCIYSPVFRDYLLDRCRVGIDAGMDVVNLDEINTSIGLIGREPGNSGFCPYCLERFRASGGGTPAADDATLRRMLAEDDELFARYRRFHELEAFEVVRGFIEELHAYAADRNAGFAVTANLAYLGNNVITHGDLWGPMWGEYVDFVMMENAYRVQRDGPHELLPRGTFTAWFRLASAFSSRAPAWICPDIRVPRQLSGQQRTRYHELMFLEAYANGGRYAYYWWPGDAAEGDRARGAQAGHPLRRLPPRLLRGAHDGERARGPLPRQRHRPQARGPRPLPRARAGARRGRLPVRRPLRRQRRLQPGCARRRRTGAPRRRPRARGRASHPRTGRRARRVRP